MGPLEDPTMANRTSRAATLLEKVMRDRMHVGMVAGTRGQASPLYVGSALWRFETLAGTAVVLREALELEAD